MMLLIYNIFITISISPLLYSTIVEANEFPFEEFFQYNGNLSATDIEALKENFLCTFYENSFYKACSCDSHCMNHQSCCIDYLWDTNSTRQNLSNYVERFLQEYNIRPKSCKPLLTQKNSDVIKSKSILMVSSCPRNADVRIKEKCRSSPTVPVYVVNETVYRNKHCAECWNHTNFTKLKLKAECSGRNKNTTDSDDFFKRYNGCVVDVHYDHLTDSLVQICTVQNGGPCTGSAKDCKLCNAYAAPIHSENQCFKNIHCINETSREYFWGKSFMGTCFDNNQFESEGFGYNIFTTSLLPKYSITFSFDDFSGEIDSPSCSPNEYYDEKMKSCMLNVTCPLGSELLNGLCIPKIIEITQPMNIDGTVTYDEIVDNCIGKSKYLIIDTSMLSNLQSNKYKQLVSIHEGNVIYHDNTTLLMDVREYNAENLSDAISSFKYKIISISSRLYLTEFYGFDMTRNFPRAKICSQPQKHTQFKVLNNCTVFFTNEGYSTKEFILVKEIDNFNNEEVMVYTCSEFHLTNLCPLRTLSLYKRYPNNTIRANNRLYNVTEYIPLKSGVGVCSGQTAVAEKSSKNKSVNVIGEIEGYLTIIGCIFSIFCYIWIIATYSIILELRTIPGKNIIGLCCCLMTSDIIMLLNIVPEKSIFFCKFLAVCLHFAGVSVYCWTVVIAYEIWSTFYGKSFKNALRSRKRFTFYLLFSLFLPAAIIIACISFELSGREIYGFMGICWIKNTLTRILTFIVIFLLSITFAVTTLTYTLVQIYKQSKKSKKLLQKSGGETTSLSRMALKLILLLGVIELLGLVQMQSENYTVIILNGIFRIMYSTVRSFRGVFIWLLYIVNRRVFNIYRGIRERRSYQSSTRLTSTSRSTTRRYKESNSLMDSKGEEAL